MRVLNELNSIADNYLSELRDVEVQKDRMRFRQNLKRLGSLMAYEISKELSFAKREVETPLEKTEVSVVADSIVLISVLRAALPFTDGFIEIFDPAEVGFIGAWRKEEGEEIEVELNYAAAPDLTGKTLILTDPMLATGKSLAASLNQILQHGKPSAIHIAAVIAAPEGVEYLKKNILADYQLWTWSLDKRLNEKSYIVPGLGDAGDLSFGSKL